MVLAWIRGDSATSNVLLSGVVASTCECTSASIRTDQRATRISTLQPARPDQCPGRMETRLRYSQLTEAFPLWWDSGSRLKGEKK
jgi:hypothetical protein